LGLKTAFNNLSLDKNTQREIFFILEIMCGSNFFEKKLVLAGCSHSGSSSLIIKSCFILMFSVL